MRIRKVVLLMTWIMAHLSMSLFFFSCNKDTAGPNVSPDISLIPTSLSISVAQGDTSSQILEVTNDGNAMLQVESIEDDAPWLTATPSLFELDEGESQEVLVVVKTASVEIGTYEASITIVSNDPDEEEAVVEVALVVGSGPDISISTMSLMMMVDPRASVRETLLVSNEGAATLRVMSINDTADWLSASPDSFDVAVGSSQEVVVTVDADSLNPGVYDATIVLESNDPDESSVEIDVDLLVNEWEEGAIKWAFYAGSPAVGSPAIGSDGTIYVAGSQDGIGSISALHPDGTLKWQFQTGGAILGTPAIGSDGTLFFGATDDCVYALNSSGTLEWQHQIDGELRSASVVLDRYGGYENIYVGSDDHYFYALSSSGALRWRYDLGSAASANAAVGTDGTVYISSRGSIHALTRWGTFQWQYHGYGDLSWGVPVVGMDGTVFFGSGDFIHNYIYALSSDGTYRWRYYYHPNWEEGGGSSPVIGPDGTIYVGGEGDGLMALNPDGSLDWESWGFTCSTPVLGADGTIYVGSWSHESFTALSPDGTSKWTRRWVGHPSPATIASDGTIYFHSSGQWVYAIASSSPGLAVSAWPKSRHDLLNTGRYSGP